MNKLALFVSFYDEYEEWPAVEWCLLHQLFKPNHIILYIDNNETEPPNISDRRITLMRLPQEHTCYNKGLALDYAIKHTDEDIIISMDGDCIPYLRLTNNYYKILTGEILNWWCISNDILKRTVRITKEDIDKTIIVGPNSYMNPNDICEPYDKLYMKEFRRPYGQRGKIDGSASIHGCNIAFTRKLYDSVEPFAGGREEDVNFYRANEDKIKYVPGPEDSCVIHVGPDMKNRGLEKPIRIQFFW